MKKPRLTLTPSRRSPPVRLRIKGVQGNVVTVGPCKGVDAESWWQDLKSALGTESDAFVSASLVHLERTARFPGGGPSATFMNAALAIIAAMGPNDEVEGTLAVQFACTHMMTMVLMGRIGGGHGSDRRLPSLAGSIAKLSRASGAQLESMRRLRGGSEQKILVQHVTVNNGGQAIVGNVKGPRARKTTKHGDARQSGPSGSDSVIEP